MHLYSVIAPGEIKIVDEDGMCVPYGVRGLLQCRLPIMFIEYLDDPDVTKDSFTRGRCYAPGDMAIMHPSGK